MGRRTRLAEKGASRVTAVALYVNDFDRDQPTGTGIKRLEDGPIRTGTDNRDYSVPLGDRRPKQLIGHGAQLVALLQLEDHGTRRLYPRVLQQGCKSTRRVFKGSRNTMHTW